jgi:hypothetical protein
MHKHTYPSFCGTLSRILLLLLNLGALVWDEGQFRDQLFDAPRTFYDLFLMSETLQSIWEEPMEVMGTLHRLQLTTGN